MRKNPDKLILGVRKFNDKNIPLRSRIGNKCTSFVFKLFCGLDISDTQSGLKGIPESFIPWLIEIEGERFEYASSCLLQTKRKGVGILEFPIETIYINKNESSHFNPLTDSIRIYSLILKYLMASMSAFVVDIIVFSLAILITKSFGIAAYILISTYCARIFSCTYSYFVNKNFVFLYMGNGKYALRKWIILCLIQATLSGALTVIMLDILSLNEIPCKMLTDILLFFFSFQVQNRWVFKGVKNVNKN